MFVICVAVLLMWVAVTRSLTYLLHNHLKSIIEKSYFFGQAVYLLQLLGSKLAFVRVQIIGWREYVQYQTQRSVTVIFLTSAMRNSCTRVNGIREGSRGLTYQLWTLRPYECRYRTDNRACIRARMLFISDHIEDWEIDGYGYAKYR